MQTVVIVGRPNVGKSLLFNRLLKKRRALVHRQPGMTLDFLRERLELAPAQSLWLTDTGGVYGERDDWSALTLQQMQRAAVSADLFLLVVDYHSGLLGGDSDCARWLRRQRTPWWLVINKAEHTEAAVAMADFHSLGAAEILTLSAKHGSGLAALRQRLAQQVAPAAAVAEAAAVPQVAVVGRPNVGKSTLINRLLGEERLVVSERAGTTRDSVSCELAHADGNIVLVDTAGIRRRPAAAERERLSLAASRRALTAADCALLLIDLSSGVTYQDKRLAALIEASGCACVVAANKADLLPPAERKARLAKAVAELPLGAPPAFAVSATAARPLPLSRLLAALRKVTAAAYQSFPTALLNTILADLVTARAPRQRGNIRPKLRYAHQGGSRPPCVVIHGNAVSRVDASYRRYLAAAYARRLALVGNSVKIVLRSEENPYHSRSDSHSASRGGR